MEDWTEEQLREAVDKKHGKEKNKATTTDKICNEFIKAIENKKWDLFLNLDSVCDIRYVIRKEKRGKKVFSQILGVMIFFC